jgi:hypothetical protein
VPGAPTLDSEMGASREGANRGPRRADLAGWAGRPLPLLHSSSRSTPRPHAVFCPIGVPENPADKAHRPTAATRCPRHAAQSVGPPPARVQDMVHVRLFAARRTNRLRPVRQSYRPVHQLHKNFDPCISPMHMRRQVVVRVREKPHAVKRLRAHTLTLAPPPCPEKENRRVSQLSILRWDHRAKARPVSPASGLGLLACATAPAPPLFPTLYAATPRSCNAAIHRVSPYRRSSRCGR